MNLMVRLLGHFVFSSNLIEQGDFQDSFLGCLWGTLDESSTTLPLSSRDSFEAETVAFIWAVCWVLQDISFIVTGGSLCFVSILCRPYTRPFLFGMLKT